MTCFETGLSVLLNMNMWEKWAPILISLLAIGLAYWQLQVGRNSTKSAQAHSIYQQYLAMCMTNTEFASGKYVALNDDDIKYEEYTWFVSSMLFAFEQVLEASPNDEKWKVTIKSQLDRHKSHLIKSSTVSSNQWFKGLQDIINAVINS